MPQTEGFMNFNSTKSQIWYYEYMWSCTFYFLPLIWWQSVWRSKSVTFALHSHYLQMYHSPASKHPSAAAVILKLECCCTWKDPSPQGICRNVQWEHAHTSEGFPCMRIRYILKGYPHSPTFCSPSNNTLSHQKIYFIKWGDHLHPLNSQHHPYFRVGSN